jgi:hypothetical protein
MTMNYKGIALAQEIAEIWITQGREAAALRLNELTVKHHIVRWEAVILTDRIRTLLINNGYNIKTLK